MKKLYGVILAACLLLTACGETPSSEHDKEDLPPQMTEGPEDTKTEEKQPESEEPSVPDEPDTPDEAWRGAYADFLEGLAKELERFRNFTHPDYDPNAPEGGAEDVMGTYMLYDIDKNGIPELLIRYGVSEVGSHTSAYGYENGEVVLYGDIHSGHTSFYTWPGENGLAYNWQHMGGHFVDRVFLAGGELVQEKFFEEGTSAPAMEYTPVEEVLPGSVLLQEAKTYVELPEIRALTLPIYDYGVERTAKPDPVRQDAVRKAVEAVLRDGAEFYGVSADGFGGDTGWTTMEQYLKPGGITEFADRPLRIDGEAYWEDLNGDGLEEAVLIVKSGEGDTFDNMSYVILTEEGEKVYAYCMNYMNSTVLEDGIFKRSWGEMFSISFGGGQFYRYTPGQERP